MCKKLGIDEIITACEVVFQSGYAVVLVPGPGGWDIQLLLADEDGRDVGAGEYFFLDGGNEEIPCQEIAFTACLHVHHADAPILTDFSAEPRPEIDRCIQSDPSGKEGTDGG